MIDVRELRRVFENGDRELVAVDRLSFNVPGGQVYGLLGPNGAGKTTTLRMILGLLKPTSGDAEIGGHLVSLNPNEVKRHIGLVSASAGLYQWLTPLEVLHFFGDLYAVPTAVSRQRAVEIAKLLDIEHFLHQRCSTLSTGQKQRVNLARALMHDPPVMLMDEPTRGLDVVGSKVIFDYIDHLRDRGKAVIVSTHRLDEAQRLCDRFGLLFRGKLRHEGTIEQVCAATGRETLTEIFLDLLEEQQPAAKSAGLAS